MLDNIVTKVAGVASGDVVENFLKLISESYEVIPKRQLFLYYLAQQPMPVPALLEREARNEHDPCAIAVYASVLTPMGKHLAKLGYVPNNVAVCPRCAIEYRTNIPPSCPQCNTPIERLGLATKLSAAMDYGVKYAARIIAVHGGTEGKWFGASLHIERVADARPVKSAA